MFEKFPRGGASSRVATSALSHGVLLAAMIAGGATTAWAQGTSTISNPPLLRPRPPATQLHTMLALPARPAPTPADAREVIFDLTVDYTDSQLWNPAVNRFDKVHLRSYQGTGVEPTQYVAPRVEVYPGQTVRMTLHNKLPKNPNCTVSGGSANVPHCFNGTNMHSHGLWINPSGNGDNVTISINPGVDFQYEYNVPPDHPAGTFWYHSHRHGSTALQVSSGMAGPLIVRGTRPPTTSGHGDLDTLLKPVPGGQPFTERVMVFQQIQYVCRYPKNDPAKNITRGQIKLNQDGTYFCDPSTDDVGQVDDYDLFVPGAWPASGRFTSINGIVLGKLDVAEAGKIERWRMIHGGVRDTISLQFRKRADAAQEPVGLRAATAQQYVDTHCTGAPVPYFLVAGDGLTMAAAAKTQVAVLQPGYRWDALVVFPEPGDYCMLDSASTESATVNQTFQPTQLLGTVHVVAGTSVTGDPSDYLKTQLKEAARVNMPENVRATVTAELDDGLKLTSFVPHADIKDSKDLGKQALTFNIDTSQLNETFFEVDGQPYDPTRIDRTLMLGGEDEWTLKSHLASHPFHIHVNPFQVVKIIAPDGQTDVSAPGAVDDFAIKDGKVVHDPQAADPQYPGLKGVWKDTLFVKNIGGGAKGAYTVVVRTRYERYIGDFVLHCHILDHEDQGMMQNIRIALPDGQGGVASAHH